jgi:NADH dehydrogenase
MNKESRKKLVIIGAGFAGLQLARHLEGSDYDVTLLDQNNFHQFQPLFYQVATARIEPTSISFPLRKVFQRTKNVFVRLGQVQQVDTAAKKVVTPYHTFDYDHLVIATGCTNNYFGNANVEKYAFPMKSTAQAVALRNRILINYEALVYATEAEKPALQNIIVVGGGPTGVEVSGALAEMKNKILPKDYPDRDFSALKIILIEGTANTLSAMSPSAQKNSRKYLEQLGVEVRTESLVKDYDGRVATLQDGTVIPAFTFIWAAGVTGNVPAGMPQETLVRGNRIKVDEYNKVIGLDGVYAIGDIAYMETPEFPKGHAQLANVAINQARNLSRNFLREEQKRKPFKYKNPGTMATIGGGPPRI